MLKHHLVLLHLSREPMMQQQAQLEHPFWAGDPVLLWHRTGRLWSVIRQREEQKYIDGFDPCLFLTQGKMSGQCIKSLSKKNTGCSTYGAYCPSSFLSCHVNKPLSFKSEGLCRLIEDHQMLFCNMLICLKLLWICLDLFFIAAWEELLMWSWTENLMVWVQPLTCSEPNNGIRFTVCCIIHRQKRVSAFQAVPQMLLRVF